MNPFLPYEYAAWEKPDGSIHLHTGHTKDGWKPLVIYTEQAEPRGSIQAR